MRPRKEGERGGSATAAGREYDWMKEPTTGMKRKGFAAAACAFCVAGLALAPAAGAQEAPICLKVKEKLSDGVDHWRGTNGKDSVTGLRGKDVLKGRGGNDRLNGGRDNDVVKGGKGDDIICGGRSADKLIGGPGEDSFDAGPGRDNVDAADGVAETVNCGSGRDRVKADRSDRLRGCERKRLVGRARAR